MNEPLVSVIVTTHNREDNVIRAVNSVINQSYRNIEIIVVDDHSSDDTAKKIGQLIEKNDNLFYYALPDPNRGACAARNYGISQAHGMYIAGLDDDDEFVPERIEKMMAAMSDEVANSYYQRLRVYKGLRAPETLFTNAGDGAGLDVITQGFGVANYYRMNGQEEKGVEMLKKVVYTAEHSKWYAAFGCLAARVDLKNIGQA